MFLKLNVKKTKTEIASQDLIEIEMVKKKQFKVELCQKSMKWLIEG